MGKKKKHTRNQGVGGGGGEQQWNEGEVDALTEALGFAFPPGAVRDVLAQCGGDVGR